MKKNTLKQQKLNTDSVGETRIIVKFSNQYGGSVELTNSQVTGLTYEL